MASEEKVRNNMLKVKDKTPLASSFGINIGDIQNLHKMKKFNPNQESFSFSENDLPSNFNIENMDDDQNQDSDGCNTNKHVRECEENNKRFGIIPP